MTGFSSISRKFVGVSSPNSAFGEMSVAQVTPTAQGTFVNTINPVTFVTGATGLGAAVSHFSGTAVLTSGQSLSGSAFLRLNRNLKYQPGQGAMARITCIFGSSATGNTMLAGVGNAESGFYFGYRNADFGIVKLDGGFKEVRTLTVTVGVATTTNVTITLDGNPITVAIAGGSNTFQTAHEISKQDYTQVGSGWEAESYENTVVFFSRRTGSANGVYSATGTGLTATFARTVAGVGQTADFTSQSNWNVDKLDGTGPSQFTLNPQKGNVYEIKYQYLGFGNTFFSVEDSRTGKFVPCHEFINANSRMTPVVRDPNGAARWQVANTNTTSQCHLTGVSAATFVEGMEVMNLSPNFAATGSLSGITAEKPILTIRSDRFGFGKTLNSDIHLYDISAGTVIGGAATRVGVVRVYKNLRITGPVNFTKRSATASICSFDTEATGFTAGTGFFIKSYTVSTGTPVLDKMFEENIELSQGDTLTITVSATDSAAFDVCTNWVENQ